MYFTYTYVIMYTRQYYNFNYINCMKIKKQKMILFCIYSNIYHSQCIVFLSQNPGFY